MYVLKSGPQMNPSQECCDEINSADASCVWEHLWNTTHVKKLIDVNKLREFRSSRLLSLSLYHLFFPCRYLSSSVSFTYSLCNCDLSSQINNVSVVLGTLKLGDHGALGFLHLFVCTPDGCNFLVQFSTVINVFVLFQYYFKW
ncbi:hypothetical protein VNO80_26499 [Phaseolus coccineus]|uniref:Uncharacterized protein n=1 Tax=Phaseolus coccineus TaxID=3886 RepID=A0AAN9LIL2_PHACN